MDKLKWCSEQRNGIRLSTPNDNLKNAYLRKAEESLQTMRTSPSRDWKIIAAYYTIYQGLYSVLMGLGVRCEIHACTIDFTKHSGLHRMISA